MDTCPITGYKFAWFNEPNWGGVFTQLQSVGTETRYSFGPIGQVIITHPALLMLQAQAQQHPNRNRPWHPVLAGICRNQFEEGKQPFEVTADILNAMSGGNLEMWYPKTFDQKAKHFLQYILRRQKGETATKGNCHYFLGSESLIYGTHEEFTQVFKYLKQQGFVDYEFYDEDDGHPANYYEVWLTDKGVSEAISQVPKPDPFAAPDRLISTGDATLDSRLNHARQLFFKHGATAEDIRSACETLSHILEPLRKDPELLAAVTSDDDVDNFFQIVNRFDIRHNKAGTMKLKHPEQYEWVFNTLLNSIMTYAKLKKRLASAGSSTISTPFAAV